MTRKIKVLKQINRLLSKSELRKSDIKILGAQIKKAVWKKHEKLV